MFDLYQIIPGLWESVRDNMDCSDWDNSRVYDKYTQNVEAAELSEMLDGYEF